LEVVKTIFDKVNFTWSFLVSSMLGALQLLLVIAFFFDLFFKKLFRKKWKLVLSFFIVIALCELLFAWLLYHPASIPSFFKKTTDHYYTHHDVNIIQFNKALSSWHPRLFYTLKPGVTGQFSNKEFNNTVAVNRLGLRDDDSSLQRPQIICLGDSYTMGWGVEQQESFPQQLEHLGGQKVLNGGISSYGTAREMILLAETDTSNLSHIVIQYCANDYLENKSFVLNNYHLAISSQALYDSTARRQQFITQYFPGKFFLLNTKIFLKQQFNRISPVFKLTNNDTGKTDIREHAQLFLEVLQHSAINFNKVKVTVIVLGDAEPFNKEFLIQLNDQLKQPAFSNYFQNRISTVDLGGLFDRSDYYPLDQHLKPSGHRKIAEKLWEAIRPH
jgi:lysophospholipase L1-like esterase